MSNFKLTTTPHFVNSYLYRARTSILALGLALTLTGCATALRFQSDIRDIGVDGNISLPEHSCSGIAQSSGNSFNDMNAPALSYQENAIQDAFKRGIELLSAADSEDQNRTDGDAGSMDSGSNLEQQLGFKLASLGINPNTLSHDAIESAQSVVSSATQLLNGFDNTQPRGMGSTSALSEGNDSLRIEVDEFLQLQESIARSTVGNGWESLFVYTLGLNAESAISSPEIIEALRRQGLIIAYMQAYFRNGEIFEVDFEQQALKERVLSELDEILRNSSEIDQVKKEFSGFFETFESELCPETERESCLVLGSIGETTFVTRAGKSYGFPGVVATISPGENKKLSTNQIDENLIVTDLVRVLLEAVADSRSSVPGTANSTLCGFHEDRCVRAPEPCEDDQQDCPFDPQDALRKVDEIADRTEAASRSVVSLAVRGGWLFALNNEALATGIETFLSVGARKLAEQVAWTQLRECSTDNRELLGLRTLEFSVK